MTKNKQNTIGTCSKGQVVFFIRKDSCAFIEDYFDDDTLMLYPDEFNLELPELPDNISYLLDLKQIGNDENNLLPFISCNTDKLFVNILSNMEIITLRHINNIKIIDELDVVNVNVGKSLCILWEEEEKKRYL